MSMTIPEPPHSHHPETPTQRRLRLQRSAEARAHPPSKADLAAAASAARETALQTALPTTSKGYQMMAKLGFKPGSALGAAGNEGARTEPWGVVVKEGKGGVGMEGERKRKFREDAVAVEGVGKKICVEEGDYRERVGREREEKRVEGLCWGAMRVLEGLEMPEDTGVKMPPPSLKKVNVLWRGLLRERAEKEREGRMRYLLHQSLTRDRDGRYEDPDEEDEDDRLAFGKEEEEDLEEDEDEELDRFLALEGKERLRMLVEHLRRKHFYCFWCKSAYEDGGMEGCPGVGEGDHD